MTTIESQAISLPESRDQPADVSSTERVTLNVGGRPFLTTVGSLDDRSDFFAAFFSGRWTIPRQEDGTIFIDADPTVFEHTLKYLRCGVFPLAFDRENGHDYKLYLEILAQAKYFQIPTLEKWLEDKCYLKCVELSTSWRRVQNKDFPTTTHWGSEFVTHLLSHRTVKKNNWVCAAEITDQHCPCSVHFCAGGPSQGIFNTEEITEWVEVGKKYSIHEGWCADNG
jgi:hypothetical protein